MRDGSATETGTRTLTAVAHLERAGGRRGRRFTGATAIAIALALPGVGTSAARIDPNRYGLRTVDAAGGSAATVAVKFTVRPVILLVVGGIVAVAAWGRQGVVWHRGRHDGR
jgi:hypothetical protein